MVQDAFGIDFTPTVRVGEVLELRKSDKDVLGYFTVQYIEQLPKYLKDFGAISAGGTTGDTDMTDLYMPDGELAAYQMVPMDDVEVTVSQPKAKKRYAAKNYVHVITSFISQVMPQQTRFWIWEDEKVYMDVKNPTRYARQRHRVLFYGWRFVLQRLAARPPVFTTIPIEGA